jgi:hypothetical protein
MSTINLNIPSASQSYEAVVGLMARIELCRSLRGQPGVIAELEATHVAAGRVLAEHGHTILSALAKASIAENLPVAPSLEVANG